jgi:hypothetical protein
MSSPSSIRAVLLSAATSAGVFWRVSVKVFTDSNGNRPSGRTDAQIQDDYTTYNQMISSGPGLPPRRDRDRSTSQQPLVVVQRRGA